MNLDLNDVAKMIQEYLSDSPLVVLGSGASVPYGLPTMGGLASELREDAVLQNEKILLNYFLIWIHLA